MTFTIEPITPTKKQSGVDFGAIVNDLDLETITRKNKEAEKIKKYSLKKKLRILINYLKLSTLIKSL